MRKTSLAFLLFCFGIAAAQTPATGNYPFSTYDARGFDSVNVGNLNVRFNIPIVSRTGRGLPFNYSLQYEGLVWTPVSNGTTSTWVPDPTYGFQGLLNGTGLKGYLTYSSRQMPCGSGGTRSSSPPTLMLSNYTYHDEYGISHRFNYSDTLPCSNGTGGSIVGNGNSTDNSGYSLNLNNPSQVLTRSGFVITPAQSATGQDPASLVDSNGNQINGGGSGNFTDTLGATALTISGSNPRVFTYPVTRQANGATTANTTLSYRSYTVRTNFQCSNIGDFGSTTVSLPDRVTFSDGSFYSFTYEGTSGASDGAVTGRLASVTLPTGGTISYSYYAACAGINADGSVASMTRTTSDGTRTYARGPINANASSTTVQDEKGNQTYYAFTVDSATRRYLETHRTVHQGDTNGPVLQDQYTCYNGAAANCDGGAVTLPVSEADVTVSYNGGTQTLTRNNYDPNGNLLLSSVVMSGGTTLWTHTASYTSLGKLNDTGEFVGPNTPANNNCTAYSYFGYDESNSTPTSGVPQHGAPSGTRGNLTSSHVSAGATYLNTSTTYYDTGVPVTTTAPDGGVTGYVYDATQGFVTATNLPTPSSGVALSTSAQYDPGTAALLSSTGMNSGETTTVNQYDALMQPIDMTLPSGSHITTSRNDVNWKFWRKTLDANRTAASEKQLDTYGRVSRVDQESGGSPDWYQMDSCYDATGLLQFQSASYAGSGMLQSNGSASVKHCSGSGTSYTYDALGRVTAVATDDGTATTQYLGRAVKTTDVNNISKITQYDLLGRISGVCEISSNSLSGQSPTACGMDIAGTGYVTSYSYDPFNHTTTVNQGGQIRTFQTDSSGRTVRTTEPERGTTTYGYSYNSTGLVVTRQRPKANQTNGGTLTTTTTQYDLMGRIASVGYDDGLTANKNFFYDAGGNGLGWSASPSNVKGRLAGTLTSSNTRSQFSYDIAGNVTTMWQCAPSICGGGNQQNRPNLSYTYDLSGAVMSAFDGASGNIAYTRSIAGEVTSVTNQTYTDAGNTPNLVTSVTNSVRGPVNWNFGNGLQAAMTYDSFSRTNGSWVCRGSNSPYCSGGSVQVFGSTVGWKGSQVQSFCDTIQNPSKSCQNNTYDEFNRLVGTSGGDTTTSYSYDRWGNRVNANGNASSFNTATNWLSGYVYDAAGNQVTDAQHTYVYDAEGKVVQVDGGTAGMFSYDAMGHRVAISTQAYDHEFLFDPFGRRQSTWLVGSSYGAAGFGAEGRIYWDRGLLANRALNGTTYFHHGNYLGTERARTDSNGNTENVLTSLPFGGSASQSSGDYNGAAQDESGYTGQDHDAETNTEHFQYRQYAENEGRWLSPDPNSGSLHFGNPQSFNRYAYVLNNPLFYTDPDGTTEDSPCDGSASCATVGYSSSGLFGANGGYGSHEGNASIFDYFRASLAANLAGQPSPDLVASLISDIGNNPFDPESLPKPQKPKGSYLDFVFVGGNGSLKERDKEWVAIQLGKDISAGDGASQIASTIQYLYDNLRFFDTGLSGGYPGGLHGGNWNFNVGIGDVSISDFYSGSSSGRYGIVPSVHIEGDHFHLDSANGSSVAGPIHWGLDVGLGNSLFRNGIPR